MSRKVIDFSKKIEKIITIPILLLDERLTSKPYKSAKNISKISIHEKIFYLLLAIAKFPTTSKKRQFYED